MNFHDEVFYDTLKTFLKPSKNKFCLFHCLRRLQKISWRIVVVMAQLVERALPTLEVHDSFLSAHHYIIQHFSTNCNFEKMKIKEEGAGSGPS